MIVLAQLDESGFSIAGLLADASPPIMLGIFIVALLRRWLILPRELDAMVADLEEVKKERDEYKGLAIRALTVGERVTNVVEGRGNV
jgi:hypothetical protein